LLNSESLEPLLEANLIGKKKKKKQRVREWM
jgi:hypothetical protein